MNLSPRTRSAFTLVELLMVIAIIGLVAAFATSGVTGYSSAASISTAGSRVAGFLEAARENAILKRQPTAVAMLSANGEAAGRVFMSLQYVPASGSTPAKWKPVSNWENLPNGVVAKLDDADYDANLPRAFSPGTTPAVSPALPSLTYKAKSYAPKTGYGYLVFLPGGGLYQSPGCSLKLVAGVSESTGITYIGSGVNNLKIIINDATGRVKVVRP
jgi:prepilin-type N-terminal cleavage/methylation domain-containing protein